MMLFILLNLIDFNVYFNVMEICFAMFTFKTFDFKLFSN